ncbi:MAG: Dabb family protein [Verrucomicrobia bacterium]|nr:Dabb family protein [Verrucomicrobiota bacterium]
MSTIKHIAFVQFKADTTPDQIDQIFNALLDLSESIPGVEDFISGPNNSPEGLTGGHTHAFVMTLADTAARDAYLTHPEHQAFVAWALPLIEKVTVLDFEL